MTSVRPPRARTGPREVEKTPEEAILLYLKRQDQRDRDMATAMHRIADVAEGWTNEVRPAVDFFTDAGRRLDRLCMFLRKWGPWLLASVPVIVMVVGAITPNAAARLALLIAALSH